jgi:hypothetical protein
LLVVTTRVGADPTIITNLVITISSREATA